jgi:hypothetical protein
MPEKIINPSRIVMGSITPIGTIALVPTATTRIPMTPAQFMANKKTLPTGRPVDNSSRENSLEENPMLQASIYFDFAKDTGRSDNEVSEKMRSLMINTKALQKQYQNVLKPTPLVQGIVRAEEFDFYLSLYENNQVYYQDRIDDHSIPIEDIKVRLTELEYWFALIIEPRPCSSSPEEAEELQQWRERERSKLSKGYSPYCDQVLYQYITPITPALRVEIAKYHRSIKL